MSKGKVVVTLVPFNSPDDYIRLYQLISLNNEKKGRNEGIIKK